MKGCFQLGCAVIVGFVILVFIVGGIFSSQHNDPVSQNSGSSDFAPAPKSNKHGWIVQPRLGSKIDLWDGTDNYCDAIKAAAQEIYDAQQAGRDVDTSAADNAPGRHDLQRSTRVEIIGHETSECAGKTVSWTHVHIIDNDSNLNGETGYIIEGLLSHQ